MFTIMTVKKLVNFLCYIRPHYPKILATPPA